MNLKFHVSERDMLAFSERFYRASPTHSRARQSSRFFLPILLSPVILLFVYKFGFSPFPIVLLVIPMIAWYVFYPIRYDMRVRANVRKQIREPSYAKMFGAYELAFDDVSLRSTGPLGESTYNWEAIDRVELTDDYLFVYFAGPLGLPVSVEEVGADVARHAHDELNRIREAATQS